MSNKEDDPTCASGCAESAPTTTPSVSSAIAPSNALESVVVVVILERSKKHSIDLFVSSGVGALGWSTPSCASGELGGTLGVTLGARCAVEKKIKGENTQSFQKRG